MAYVLRERVENGVHLLDALLRLLDLALDDHKRASQLVEHVGAAGIQLVLSALELFQARFFFFDFLLLLLEAFELSADLLDLIAKLSSGVVEGLNNKAKVTMRRSYGFRTFRILELALYHSLGKLPEPQLTHEFF